MDHKRNRELLDPTVHHTVATAFEDTFISGAIAVRQCHESCFPPGGSLKNLNMTLDDLLVAWGSVPTDPTEANDLMMSLELMGLDGKFASAKEEVPPELVVNNDRIIVQK